VSLLRQAPGRAERIELQRSEPVVTADAVAVGYGEGAEDAAARIAEQVAVPLADAGWRVPDVAPPSEVASAELPTGNGLASPAVLEALQQTWLEVAR
jgi:hypothetical protein